MKRKRYVHPEAVLNATIAALEMDDGPLKGRVVGDVAWSLLRSYQKALLDLLSMGPLLCVETWLRETAHPDASLTPEDTLLIRAELLALIRNTIRGQSSPISTSPSRLSFSVRPNDTGRVTIAADGTTRDVIILQFVMLLQHVGLANVRMCLAPDCGRVFVKTYRREFCSVQCQKRVNARKQRQQARERRERQARTRRLRKGQ